MTIEGAESPVTLVAHMDTVFTTPPRNIFYDREQNVIWSPYGGVGDDRLGIFLILLLLKAGHRPHVIFTNEEETGGMGARDLVAVFPEYKFKTNYFIELDRQGVNDAVFYDCANEDFIKYITNVFHFEKDYGSFTDISILCPAWGIAGVNLSIGYIEEHSFTEHVYLTATFHTLTKVGKMISSANKLAKPFIYIPGGIKPLRCPNCEHYFNKADLIPVILPNKVESHFCLDCVCNSEEIEWCCCCGNAFIGKGDFCSRCRDLYV